MLDGSIGELEHETRLDLRLESIDIHSNGIVLPVSVRTPSRGSGSRL